MTIANVALTDTFDQWRVKTNQLIVQQEETHTFANSAYVHANASFEASNNSTQTAANLATAILTSNAVIIGIISNTSNGIVQNYIDNSDFVVVQNKANLAYQQSNIAFNQSNTTLSRSNTALDQSNVAFDHSNVAFSHSNTTYLHSNTAYLQSNTAFDQSNTALEHSNIAYSQSNVAYTQSNVAYSQSNVAYLQSNNAYDRANTALNDIVTFTADVSTSVGEFLSNDPAIQDSVNVAANAALATYLSGLDFSKAYVQANQAFLVANSAYDFANGVNVNVVSAYAFANVVNTFAYGVAINAAAAFASANNVAPQVAPSFNTANAAYTVANASYSFANTINTFAYGVAINAAAAFESANNVAPQVAPSFNTANAAFNKTNSAYTVVNAAYTVVNASYTSVNAAYVVVNAAFGLANSTNTLAYGTVVNAAAAFSQANNSGALAQLAYDYAYNSSLAANNYAGAMTNSANSYATATYLPLTGGTITSTLNVQGNLTVTGAVTYVNTTQLLIGDNQITLNNDLPSTSAPTENAGLEVNRGASPNVYIQWNEASDKWTFTNDGTNYRNISSNTDMESANNYAGAMANSANAVTATVAIAANNYSGAMANSGNAYTVTVGTSANNYAGAMANASNAVIATVATSANNYSGAMANSANAYTVTVGTAANNYAGAMANASNAKADTKVSSVSGTAGRVTSSGGTTPTIDLATSGVTACTYGGSAQVPAITVDSYGRITSASNAAISAGVSSVSGTTGRITSSGGSAPTIDLATAGAGACTYSSGISSITVDAYGRVTSVSGSAGYSTGDITSVSAGTGLTGGGTSGDVTLSLNTFGAGSATYSSGISSMTVDAYGRVSAVSGSGGYLTSITSSQVTTALGYTPYNSTNPNGYVTSSGVTSITASTGLTGGTITTTGTLALATVTASGFTLTGGVSALTADAYGRVTSATGSAGYVTSSGVTSITASTGLTGGTITTTGTLALATVTASGFTLTGGISALTADAYGRVTSATGSAGYYTSGGALGTPASGTLTNCTFPTLNQNTTGSAATFTSTSQNSQFNSIGAGVAASGTAGTIKATGDITAYASSDQRLKENITPISNALDIVNQINGVNFDWSQEYIDREGGEDGYFVRKHDIGVIAQEVEKVLPEVVADREDGYKAVRYEKMVAVLIQAVKELSAEVNELKSRIKD